MNQYFNRYDYFNVNSENKIVPFLEIPVKGTDKFVVYRKGKTRMDILSQEYYSSPLFGWLIMLANPEAGSLEFEIADNTLIRIPFPLITSLQDYKKQVELYKLYYGE